MEIRAHFDMRLAGEPEAVEHAAVRIGDQLAEAGFTYDEDYEALLGPTGGPVGLRLNTLAVLHAACRLMPKAGIYAVQTDRDAEAV